MSIETGQDWVARYAPWILVGILMIAGVLRLFALGAIPPGLWYDEAIYALDAMDVLRGRWTIFFTTETPPREPLFIYSLAGFFVVFGHSVVKARIVSALWGIATVAVFYPVARRIVGCR